MKITTLKILTTLLTKAEAQDKKLLEIALDTVDDLNQDHEKQKNAIEIVKNAGHDDFAHFLELLLDNHFAVNISNEYHDFIFNQ
ncbi:MAG: hypothetical protein GXP61_01345 [Epsilonproteobacteria bacterium]|nr:hypothetical protein [Campylobacterota bacterium]